MQIILNSTALGGGNQIFRLRPNEDISEYLLSLPEEITKSLLYHLPVNDVIDFCSASPKFRILCEDPEFWRKRSSDLKSTNEIYEIFVQAVHYGIYPLIYTLIDKLSENRLTDRNLKFILTSVISSG